MKLLVATRNRHKLDEIRRILAIPGVELVDLSSFPDIPEVAEDGATFAANAVKKAVVTAVRARLWTMADDSGLEVEALGGEPGVRSARYAGEPVDYTANNRKLLDALKGAENRAACFRCTIALSSPSGQAQVVEGTVAGTITTECRGGRGFGYDPLFVPDGYKRTFAEMDPDGKNEISHRANALRAARWMWGEFLAGGPATWQGFVKPRAD